MAIEFVSVCDIGKLRPENQDAVYAKTGDEWGIFIVADGMGGHSDGSRASREIVASYKRWIEKVESQITEYEISFLFSELRRILCETNEKILADTEQGSLCGSTAVILLIVRKMYILLSVGDSRCYELKRNFFKTSLRKLSSDEICEIPGRNYGKLTNAVGARVPLKCKLVSGEVNKKHTFFLCSDGVYKFCTEKELTAIIGRKNNVGEPAETRIKKLVYEKGAKDNFSAIVVSVAL